MTLNSFEFLVFFSIVYITLFIAQVTGSIIKKEVSHIQKYLLLIASMYFIQYSNFRFLLAILFVSIGTFFIGIFIDRQSNKRYKQILLILGVSMLLIMLGYFKYSNFFIESINNAFNFKNIELLNIILPLGISYYVFSTMSYLIDVYQKKYSSEKKLIDYSIFVLFFPKIISGPIIRADNFMPQIKKYKGLNWVNFNTGIQIFIFGLFKKIVLADHLGIFVDDIFTSPSAYHSLTIIIAVISYSLQIYFDFSGYSDMAIGLSKMLGFDIQSNFNLPYLSSSISEFWQRWHITLSSWFRDYVYFPLGGSRVSAKRKYFNLFIVMFLSGIWHGVGWTFIVWGSLHGIWSCIENGLKKYRVNDSKNRLQRSFSIIFTYGLVTLFWVFFRANSLKNAFEVLRGIFIYQNGILHIYLWTLISIVILVFASILAMFNSEKDEYRSLSNKTGQLIVNGFYPIMDLTKMSSQIIFFTFIGLTIMFGYFGDTAFIYGAF